MSTLAVLPEEQVAPALSAEVFVIPCEEGRYIVYAPLRRAAFIANERVVNFLADLQDGFWDQAADPDGSLSEFLRRLEILDAGPEDLPITTFSSQPEPTAVTLFLTTACNLRCTYCYASAGDTPTRTMGLEVAKKGIDFIIANAVKRKVPHIDINYHGGGEPTVNWKTITGSLEYARQKAAASNIEVRAFLASNGVLPDEKIDWIIANTNGCSLSFDGLPEVHDTHRLTVLGQGSSEQVMHTARRFDAANYPYGLRLTVTADQISRLPESVEFVCRKFHPMRIQVEPAYQLGRWHDAPSAETAEFITAFREAQGRARRYGHEIWFSAARLGLLTNHFCGVTQDSFALSPDGNVSACYEVFSEDNPRADNFFYGKPSEGGGYTFNLPVLDDLRGQAVQHRDYCQGCYAKWSCGGDCYHKALTVNGPGEFAGSDRCHITRELTKDQILARIASAGGIFWHEAPTEQATAPAMGKEMLA